MPWPSLPWTPASALGTACRVSIVRLRQSREHRTTQSPSRQASFHLRARLSSKFEFSLFVCFHFQQPFTLFLELVSRIRSIWRPSSKSSCKACWTASMPCDSSTNVSTRDVLSSRPRWSRSNHRLVLHTFLSDTLPSSYVMNTFSSRPAAVRSLDR
jgi:hypothetical protein